MKEQKVALFNLDRILGHKPAEEVVTTPEIVVSTTSPVEKEKEQGDNPMTQRAKKLGGKLVMKNVKPLTFTQVEVFKRYMGGYNILMHGIAGTGKTFVAMYLALKDLERFQLEYDKVVIVRSVVPSRDMGYLPGSVKDKAAVFEAPYEKIVNTLYQRGDAYQILKAKGALEFMTTSFLRGVTLERSIVIVDEIQNMTYPELATVITRMGDRTRVIFAGDFRQTDFWRDSERAGIFHFMKILNRMEEFSLHEFNIADIVRSKLVKSFIIEENEYRDKTADFQY